MLVGEVQDAQPVVDAADGFDPVAFSAELFGEQREPLELGECIGQVVRVRVGDGDLDGAVVGCEEQKSGRIDRQTPSPAW